MKKEHSKLIDKILSSLDWDSIFEVYKAFKMGVGEGNTIVPGIKRKPFSDRLSKNDIKAELKVLLKHVVDGGINEINYGPWIILWTDGDWEYVDEENVEEDEYEGEETEDSVVSSRLEVIYAPQRIALIVNSFKEELAEEEEDSVMLEMMMQKAIQKEDYELASKFKDILKHQNKEAKSDT